MNELEGQLKELSQKVSGSNKKMEIGETVQKIKHID